MPEPAAWDALFAAVPVAEAPVPGKLAPIAQMHAVYGVTPGERCVDCASFVILGAHARNYWKCARFRLTNGPATDWRKNYVACGLFARRARS